MRLVAKRWTLLLALIIGWSGSFVPVFHREARTSSHPSCACRDCGGGEQCCCVHVEKGVAKAVALNRCDRAEQQVAAGFSMPRWAPYEPLEMPAPALLFTGYRPFIIFSISRSVSPREPPPRSL